MSSDQIPLFVDDVIESSSSNRTIWQKVKSIFRRPPHRGRRSIYSQLRNRPKFDVAAWAQYEIPQTFVVEFLKQLQTELQWPNHHFLPTDRLGISLISAYDEYPWGWFFAKIKKRFGISYSDQDFLRMKSEDIALISIIKELWDACRKNA